MAHQFGREEGLEAQFGNVLGALLCPPSKKKDTLMFSFQLPVKVPLFRNMIFSDVIKVR
jgi:hypothetical protein